MCQDLLTNICREDDKGTNNIHTYAIKDILLSDLGTRVDKVGTRSKTRNHTATPPELFDIDNYMAHYKSKDYDSSEDNANISQILLLSIQRYHDLNGTFNNQPIKFSDTITLPAQQLQYTLTGYVLFNGNHDKGHYRVICRGQDNRWFLYDDEDTRELNERERNHHNYKSAVVLLLYAEQSYYNNVNEDYTTGRLATTIPTLQTGETNNVYDDYFDGAI